jgi:hypothetical protein
VIKPIVKINLKTIEKDDFKLSENK